MDNKIPETGGGVLDEQSYKHAHNLVHVGWDDGQQQEGFPGDGFFDTKEERLYNIREVMSKYGENKWWLSPDSIVQAYYQIFESTVMVPDDIFLKGTELLLGYPLHRDDLVNPGIREKARNNAKVAWEQYQKSLEQTGNQGQTAAHVLQILANK